MDNTPNYLGSWVHYPKENLASVYLKLHSIYIPLVRHIQCWLSQINFLPYGQIQWQFLWVPLKPQEYLFQWISKPGKQDKQHTEIGGHIIVGSKIPKKCSLKKVYECFKKTFSKFCNTIFSKGRAKSHEGFFLYVHFFFRIILKMQDFLPFL